MSINASTNEEVYATEHRFRSDVSGSDVSSQIMVFIAACIHSQRDDGIRSSYVGDEEYDVMTTSSESLRSYHGGFNSMQEAREDGTYIIRKDIVAGYAVLCSSSDVFLRLRKNIRASSAWCRYSGGISLSKKAELFALHTALEFVIACYIYNAEIFCEDASVVEWYSKLVDGSGVTSLAWYSTPEGHFGRDDVVEGILRDMECMIGKARDRELDVVVVQATMTGNELKVSRAVTRAEYSTILRMRQRVNRLAEQALDGIMHGEERRDAFEVPRKRGREESSAKRIERQPKAPRETKDIGWTARTKMVCTTGKCNGSHDFKTAERMKRHMLESHSKICGCVVPGCRYRGVITRLRKHMVNDHKIDRRRTEERLRRLMDELEMGS